METIYQSFLDAARKHSQRTALLYKKEGKYSPITYGELNDSVDAVAAGLRKLGIGKGDRVGIFSYNRPEWLMADLAALKLGGVVVPIYHTLPAPVVRFIIKDSMIKLLFVENAELLSLIDGIRNRLPSLKTVVVFDDSQAESKSKFLRFEDVKKKSDSTIDTPITVDKDDVATIVYTSGTTGNPKGVILTHNNIVTNTTSAIEVVHGNSHDVVVSYLPLCHMLERTCCCYSMLFLGGSIAFAENLTTIAQDVATIRPTIMLAVPRVLEKVHHEVTKRVMEGPGLQKILVASAIRNLNTYANLKYRSQKVPLGLWIRHLFYDAVVGSKFRKIGGGKLRMVFSGGAPLDKKIAKVFYVLGFNILQGYGLTETSPVVCCNTIEDNVLGTVGKPLEGVEVRIGKNSEILVKGPNVMKGYLNKPAETAKVIDKDGWFHTGDQGRFDKKGNLIITGRIKELIVTSYGANIAPAPIEAKITHSPYVEQAMIFGEKRKYLVALLVPHQESVEKYAGDNNIPFDDYPSLLESSKITELIEHEIEEVNVGLAHHEQARAFALIPEKFTIENGLLTPTLKLRRKMILKRYAKRILSLYKKPGKRNEN